MDVLYFYLFVDDAACQCLLIVLTVKYVNVVFCFYECVIVLAVIDRVNQINFLRILIESPLLFCVIHTRNLVIF